ncbi:DNA endonuclease SmrA [bacterium]|nr:DNA endonuclease SmrA [bacterium]
MSDDDIFRVSLGDVRPLKLKPKVNLNTAGYDPLSMKAKREAAVSHHEVPSNPLTDGRHIETVDPLAVLEFQRPGVQHGVYKKLRLGKYPIDAELDLHQMDLHTAQAHVFQFIRDCQIHSVRCGLITHGKGEGRARPAVLKSAVAHWLMEMPQILAYHSALKHHGGVGATYLLLKKSEQQREDNREKF